MKKCIHKEGKSKSNGNFFLNNVITPKEKTEHEVNTCLLQ